MQGQVPADASYCCCCCSNKQQGMSGAQQGQTGGVGRCSLRAHVCACICCGAAGDAAGGVLVMDRCTLCHTSCLVGPIGPRQGVL